MPHPSIDALQNSLSRDVFFHATDRKKAAGRALGTLVEVITYYLLRAWGFRNSIAIERRLEEYNNSEITHNVEYSLYPVTSSEILTIEPSSLPISLAKLKRILPDNLLGFDDDAFKSSIQLLTSDLILRNSCTLAEDALRGILMAHLEKFNQDRTEIGINVLLRQPWAIVECKRVGVEEGASKGPQTIEKAKQGAYVARTISSLQKIRLADGRLGGLIYTGTETPIIDEHALLMERIINSESEKILSRFTLSIGIVSNHGNWFSGKDRNKELAVLVASYDWLIFLTDQGLTDFIQELLLEPTDEMKPVREAFLSSYAEGRKKNRFTKVQMDLAADALLQKYFSDHHDRIEKWFNVISPIAETLTTLRHQLSVLRDKNWNHIHN